MSEAEKEGVVTEAAEDGDAGDTAEPKAAPEEVDMIEEAATEWRRQRAAVEATYDGTFGGGGEIYDRQKERMDIIEAALKKVEKKGKQKTVGFAMWAKEVPVGSELPAPIWTKDGQRQGKFWTKVVSRNQ
jgi:transcription elongation GreA/GreB family factor